MDNVENGDHELSPDASPADPSSGAASTSGRRRGRPPATDSAATKQTILNEARRLFADRGYGAVTNKDVATASGITAGALYHYVESKRDLYLAVNRDVQRKVYQRFQAAFDGSDTFIGKFDAVLDAAHELNDEDPSMARFVGAIRIDLRRHTELRGELVTDAGVRDRFFVGLVDVGIATGEIVEEDRLIVAEFIRTILIGLTDGVSTSSEGHQRAIDGIKSAMRGTLVKHL